MGDNKNFISKEVLITFVIESKECLQKLESSLVEIEKGDQDQELLNSIFRSIHTIKGTAGMFGFKHIEGFTHYIESLLDKVRKGTIPIDSEMISILLESKDLIDEYIELIDNTENDLPDDEMLARSRDLKEKLSTWSDIPLDKEKEEVAEEEPAAPEAGGNDDNTVINKYWHISLRFGKNIYRNAMDPLSFITYLKKIGEIKHIAPVSGRLPDLDSYDPRDCYLGFEIDLDGEISKKKIEDVFEFYMDDCMVRILPPESKISDYMYLINSLPEEDFMVGEILTSIGSLTKNELQHALEKQTELKDQTRTAPRLGEILIEQNMVQKPVIEEAVKKQDSIRKKQSSMRIDSGKIDAMINLVGELVITGANINQLSEAETIDRTNLRQSALVMSRLIEDIRDNVMSMRMVPIGTTFKRFERIVRDLSLERNKEIDLVITGGETEFDKSLIEKMTDPLLHIIRNAIDHGIDSPEKRLEKGKDRRGKIYMNAYHETGNVIIEINDDGEGLNREKIHAKALETDMISADEDIPDTDLFQFIFDAGFSTAEEVTNISGRGVGMDVVKKNIEALRGSIILESKEGEGTSIRIHLPLTLSIIDGFLFQVGESYYVVPLDIVHECTERRKDELYTKDGGNYLNLRGEVLPFLRLRDFFEEEGEEPDITNIIVVKHRGAMAGLVVDKLSGEFQTVIKPLGEVFKDFRWISGITILGTGEVAIILDIPNLIRTMENLEKGNVGQTMTITNKVKPGEPDNE